jgi:hypothetical protein
VPVVAALAMIIDAVFVQPRRSAASEGALVGEPGLEPGTGRI